VIISDICWSFEILTIRENARVAGKKFRNFLAQNWRKPEFPEKTTDLPQVTDKRYHIEIILVLLPINNSQTTVDER
jgi:hypothetical protein